MESEMSEVTKVDEKGLPETEDPEIIYVEEPLWKRIISSTLEIIVMLLITLLVFIFVRYEPRYVVSGSMEPTIEVGALTFVDAQAYAKGQDPEVGDIILYRSASGREVMHRVIRVESEDDEVNIYCQGDNNNSEDFSPVLKMQIIGRTKYIINFVAPLVRIVTHLEA